MKKLTKKNGKLSKRHTQTLDICGKYSTPVGNAFHPGGWVKFSFQGRAGKIIQAQMAFYRVADDSLVDTGSPEVVLIAPDGSTVPKSPSDPPTSGGISQELYALPQTGTYTMIAQGNPGDGVSAYYKLSYSYQPPPTVTSISIQDGNTQILPVVRGGTTVFNPMSVLVKNGSTAVTNFPVIFKSLDKEYMEFTNGSGVATISGVKTPKPPIQGRIIAYPAGHSWLKAKFDFVLVEAYSKDDWDGDGVMNADDPHPFAVEASDFPVNITAEDSDGDGLDNKFEQIIGTDENNLDTDGDGYPDGFEVANNLDPLNSDPVSVKLIPLGFYADLNETIFLYAVARDQSGHFRKDIALDYSDYGNLTIQSPCFPDTDIQGLSSCKVETAYEVDSEVFYPIGDPEPSTGHNHHLTVNAGTSSDELYFLAIPGRGKDPLEYIYGQHQAWCSDGNTILGCPYSLTNRCLWVRAKTEAGKNVEGAGIEFSVVDNPVTNPPQTKPDHFQNVMLSKRATPDTPPFDYPNPWVFMGDDPGDAVDRLTVYTNRYGVTSACFYWGNTDNFTYQIKARNPAAAPEDGNSVVFDLKLLQGWTHHPYSGTPPHPWSSGVERFTDSHDIPEYALYGKDAPVNTILKNFEAANEDCCDGDTVNTPCESCPFNIPPPAANWVISWFWNVGSWPGGGIPQAYSEINDKGIASATVTVPTDLGNNSFYVRSGTVGIAELKIREIKGRSLDYITMQMFRLTKQNTMPMPEIQDGGTISELDQAIILTINNPLSYFLELELVENPTKGGDMLYPVQREHYKTPNIMIVFPGSKDYYFEIPKPVAPGNFTFNLRDKETGEVLKNMHGYIIQGCTEIEIENQIRKYDQAYKQWRKFTVNDQGFDLTHCGPYIERVDFWTSASWPRNCGLYAMYLKAYLDTIVENKCNCVVTEHQSGTLCNILNHSRVNIDCTSIDNKDYHKWYDPYWRACLPW